MKKLDLAIALAYLWSGAAHAQSKLILCNEDRSDILRVNMIYNNSYLAPLTESWKVYGWMDIPAGRCQPIVQHPSRVLAFLSVVEKSPSGRLRIMHFPFDGRRDHTQTAERFFCVRDDPHDRVLKTLDEHERCPPQWHAQLFNLYVALPPYTNFTLSLGGKTVSP